MAAKINSSFAPKRWNSMQLEMPSSAAMRLDTLVPPAHQHFLDARQQLVVLNQLASSHGAALLRYSYVRASCTDAREALMAGHRLENTPPSSDTTSQSINPLGSI